MEPISFIINLVLLIASYAIAAMTAPKPKGADPASFGDFDLPETDEGTPQIVVFGDVWLTNWTVLWYGNFRTSAIKSSGGKK